jgi:dTDP-4-amino-4,6-dideoxygalactose transaminase
VVPETITLDLEDVHQRITSRSKVLMPVHYASNPGGLAEMYDFARGHGLRVIEDAAHAFGCRYHGKKIGASGDIVCFSFDGIKNITSGEGGAIVTDDPAVAQRGRDARLLGVERDTDKRFSGQRSWEFDVHEQGYRYHLSNVLAAIGRVQLRRFPGELAPARVHLARRYRQLLGDVPGIGLLNTNLDEIVPHIQPVRILNGQRNALREFLGTLGIETGIHYQPNHLLSLFGGSRVSLPVTEQLYGELLSLPLHPLLDETEVVWICDQIKAFLSGQREGV